MYDVRCTMYKPCYFLSLLSKITVTGPSSVQIPGARACLTFRVFDRNELSSISSAGKDAVVFDADRALFPITVRSHQEGDVMSPWGMEGSESIRVECPTCGTEVVFRGMEQTPCFPFCCERCKLLDLGEWLDGARRISTPLEGDEPSSPE